MSHEIEKPVRLTIDYVDTHKDLMAAKGSASDTAFTFFGTAFRQGGRMRFVTAMPISQYLQIVRDPADTVAKRNSTITGIENKANRPTDDTHRKKISRYVREQFGTEAKGELGGFTLNYGLETSIEADNECTLTILGKEGSFICAAAVLVMRNPEKPYRMHATDGAHRTRSLLGIKDDKNVMDEEKKNIMTNGVPVTIVFESDMAQAHQDFADAASAMPIKNAIKVGYDIRTPRNEVTVKVIKASKLLHNRVSMTASSVNVSSSSKAGILYTATALTMFVSELVGTGTGEEVHARLADLDPILLASYWDTLPKYFPLFRSLEDSGKLEPTDHGKLEADRLIELTETVTRNHHRTARGGNFLLRAAFCPLMARAIKEASVRGIKMEAVLAAMTKLSWTVFLTEDDFEAYTALQRNGYGASEAARQCFNKMLLPVIVASDTRFKFSTTSDFLDALWDNICMAIWHEPSRLHLADTSDIAA